MKEREREIKQRGKKIINPGIIHEHGFGENSCNL
jgi:hypothetical protein